MEGVPVWLIWVGSVIGTILSLLGAAKLVEILFTRFLARRDRKNALDESNAGKLIDADQAAFKIIADRLEAVEKKSEEQDKKIESLTTAHNQLMIENERLKTDAKHAEKEMVRQADEIKSLRDRNHILSNDLQARDAQIQQLETKHAKDVAELHALIKTLETQLQQFRAARS